MRKFQISSAMVFLLLIVSIGGAAAQTGVSQLDPLVTTSARRLAIAQQVALSKWDSGAAVEDAPREAQVILGSVKAGEARGIDSALAMDTARRRREFIAGSGMPILAATVMSRDSLENSLDRTASARPFLCMMFLNLLWPAMSFLSRPRGLRRRAMPSFG